jgi:hypothetical protein
MNEKGKGCLCQVTTTYAPVTRYQNTSKRHRILLFQVDLALKITTNTTELKKASMKSFIIPAQIRYHVTEALWRGPQPLLAPRPLLAPLSR